MSVVGLFRNDNSQSEINCSHPYKPLLQRTVMAMIPQGKSLQDIGLRTFQIFMCLANAKVNLPTTGPPPPAQTPQHAPTHKHAPFMQPPSAGPFNFPMPQVTLPTVSSLGRHLHYIWDTPESLFPILSTCISHVCHLVS